MLRWAVTWVFIFQLLFLKYLLRHSQIGVWCSLIAGGMDMGNISQWFKNKIQLLSDVCGAFWLVVFFFPSWHCSACPHRQEFVGKMVLAASLPIIILNNGTPFFFLLLFLLPCSVCVFDSIESRWTFSSFLTQLSCWTPSLNPGSLLLMYSFSVAFLYSCFNWLSVLWLVSLVDIFQMYFCFSPAEIIEQKLLFMINQW